MVFVSTYCRLSLRAANLKISLCLEYHFTKSNVLVILNEVFLYWLKNWGWVKTML
jgi:hypothetical protein